MRSICGKSNRVATRPVSGPEGRWKLAGGEAAIADAATGIGIHFVPPPRMGRRNGAVRSVSRAPAGAHEFIGVAFRGRRCACSRLMSGNPPGWRVKGGLRENMTRARLEHRARQQRREAYYGASGVIDSIDGFTHEGEFVLIGEDGANLLSRSTPIAFLAKGQIWVNNHAQVLRCKHAFPNAYLAAYINSIDLAPYVSGTAQPNLNQPNMNSIPVPVPPLPEQQEILRRVAGLFALADQLEERLQKARSRVCRITPSLLTRAFRGQLVPQDPTDEPAEKLLKRIQSK